MITLEQVQLLESRVSKAIEYVQKVTRENTALVSQREELQAKLEANQKRIDELEVLVMRFKEDQGRIEDGIIAALDRLSQFEEAFENSLKEKTAAKKPAGKPEAAASASSVPAAKAAKVQADQDPVFFEIKAPVEGPNETGESIVLLEEDKSVKPASASTSASDEGELDIF